MNSWSLLASAVRPEQRALARVVAGIGLAGFAHDTLAGLNGLFPVGSWSVYELLPGRPPRMHLSASSLRVDSTADCFAAYRDEGIYRQDHSFDRVRGEVLMLRSDAEDMSAPHREAIYRRHAMLERLSVAQARTDGCVLAVNLYRHEGQGLFSAADTESFAATALPLLAAVQRHIDCTPAEAPEAGARGWLQRLDSSLTAREVDVLELLLRGLTYDGIAAQLGLGTGTVKTYRARAFGRLGIHFKNELFALAMQKPGR